jgi:hypothetical protein
LIKAGGTGDDHVVFALTVVLTCLLLLEVVPSAVAGLTRARAGRARLDELTRLGTAEGRHLGLVTTLGALHTLGTAGLLIGLASPAYGVAGAALEALIFGAVLARQIRYGDRGRTLGAYSLFTTMALAVLVVNVVRVMSG